MKKVSVSNGEMFALVDDEDFEKVNQLKWYKDSGRNGDFYAKANNKCQKDWPSTIQMHRLVMGLKEGQFIDHIDHNGLNNQKSNLRVVSNKQNCLNRNKQIGNYTSKYRGVCFSEKNQKWHSYINIQDSEQKTQIHLGYYDDEETAGLIYDKAMKERYGDDFLNPNFPDFGGEYPEVNVRKTKGYYFDPNRNIWCVEFRKNKKRFRAYAKTEVEAIQKRKELEGDKNDSIGD